MHQVIPLAALSRDQVVEIARNAADNGAPLHEANVFEPGTRQHHTFTHAYWERHRQLTEAEA
jgi:hypothetical protein